MIATDWPAALRLALSLGLPPHRFWRLSLREWRAITAPSGPAPLSRAEFEALSRQHPDRPA